MQLSESEAHQAFREGAAIDRPAGPSVGESRPAITARREDGVVARADAGGTPAHRAAPAAPAEPPVPSGSPAGNAAAAPAPRKKGKRRAILLTIIAIALGAGGYEGYHWWTTGRFELSTDDAYVAADMSILSAKVSGYVTEVAVSENQAVKTGDVIARIDDGDYRLAVQSAEDKIAVQKAAVERIGVQIEAALAGVDKASADVASAEATLALMVSELDRKTKLAKTDFASKQAVDTARADHDKAVAGVAGAKAALAQARADVSVLEAQKAEAEATLASLSTALKQAERDLSFTVVRAPVDGVVGNKAVEVGELVQPGTRLAAVVPLASVYAEANFKETQLEDMHAGQEADITVDAFPGRVFKGEVASISPASGALFSLLPPENATGNFTKIVQRLPVRIELSDEAKAAHALRPGMSVVVTVDTRTGSAGPETSPQPAAALPEAAPSLPSGSDADAEPVASTDAPAGAVLSAAAVRRASRAH